MIVTTAANYAGIMAFIADLHPNTVSPSSNRSRNPRQSKSNGQVRIVAGRWRGRKLNVPDVAGLRPTGDRVRETLFNWLQSYIGGARCLDLFAGSGALGIEALSRHAKSAVFVEPNSVAASTINAHLVELEHASKVEQTTAQAFLASNQTPFDIVFVDPPFDAGLQWDILCALQPNHLAPNALVYMEASSKDTFPEHWPEGYELLREKQFGDVITRLFSVSDAD